MAGVRAARQWLNSTGESLAIADAAPREGTAHWIVPARTTGGKLLALRIPKNDDAAAIDQHYTVHHLAAKANIAPAILWHQPGDVMVLPWLTAESDPTPEQAATALHRLHGIKPSKEVEAKIPKLCLSSLLDTLYDQAREHGAPIPLSPEHSVVRRLCDDIAKHPQKLCHNDLLPPNLIATGEQLYLIDWEYAGWNSIYFDLASLLSARDQAWADRCIAFYAQLGSYDTRALLSGRFAYELVSYYWYAAKGLPPEPADAPARLQAYVDQYQ
jgi:thiamine kinase-like enzyme